MVFKKGFGKQITMVTAVLFFILCAVPDAVYGGAQPALVASTDVDDNDGDPLEPVNRMIFGFNEVIRDSLLGPVAHAYNDNLPANVRLGIGNFLDNLSSPISFANSILQGDLRSALSIFARFLINSTVGMVGIIDVVGEVDGDARDEDFGQTLGVWGIGEGFYLVLPVFGPSSPRDVVGKFLVDPYFDPFGSMISDGGEAVDYSEQAVSGVDEYSGVVDELEQIKKTSVDYYAAVRSLYRQKRKSEISNGKNLDLPPVPNLSYDLVPEDFNQSLGSAVTQ
ncbi:MAG: hypothetical protein CMF69_04025 [Magnetovibrio sp.]|nr:hypothetical protein [Magnetovibrio sp.]